MRFIVPLCVLGILLNLALGVILIETGNTPVLPALNIVLLLVGAIIGELTF